LPWMMNAKWVTHTLIVSAITTLFLFQMAMLADSVSIEFGEPKGIRKQRRFGLTCEALSIAKKRKAPGSQRPRKREIESAILSHISELERIGGLAHDV